MWSDPEDASTAQCSLERAGDAQRVERRANQLSQITRAVVLIYEEQFGRGPRYAHSHHSGLDAITCFLEGSLTPVERTLATIGEDQRLRDIRLLFQYAAEEQFRGALESITGRRVVAFQSVMDAHADVATEVFVLESNSNDGAVR